MVNAGVADVAPEDVAPVKVGLVGVGTMGSRMAAALAEDPIALTIHDKDSERAERVGAETSVQVAKDPGELARDAEIVLMSLPGPEDVADVVHGLLDAGTDLRVIVDLSTVDPGSTRTRAAEARDRGVEYLDAPVLGRPARCGRWTLPVGGSTEALELARPALERLATQIVHTGDSGAGNVIKLCNNLMFGAINAMAVESMEVARRLGVDLQVYFDTISNSGAATVSNLFLEIAPKIVSGDTTPDFALDLLHKDNLLALDMARSVGAPLFVSSAVSCLNAMGKDRGMGALDTSALSRLFANDADDSGQVRA